MRLEGPRAAPAAVLSAVVRKAAAITAIDVTPEPNNLCLPRRCFVPSPPSVPMVHSTELCCRGCWWWDTAAGVPL